MSHDTLRRIVSDAYNTQSAGMTVGLPRVKVDASQLRALIAHYDSLIAERDTLRAEVERLMKQCEYLADEAGAIRSQTKIYSVTEYYAYEGGAPRGCFLDKKTAIERALKIAEEYRLNPESSWINVDCWEGGDHVEEIEVWPKRSDMPNVDLNGG